VAMEEHRFWLYASPGPLWRRSLAEAREIGRRLSARLSNSPESASEISPGSDAPMA
jgi:hypothetical protein